MFKCVFISLNIIPSLSDFLKTEAWKLYWSCDYSSVSPQSCNYFFLNAAPPEIARANKRPKLFEPISLLTAPTTPTATNRGNLSGKHSCWGLVKALPNSLVPFLISQLIGMWWSLLVNYCLWTEKGGGNLVECNVCVVAWPCSVKLNACYMTAWEEQKSNFLILWPECLIRLGVKKGKMGLTAIMAKACRFPWQPDCRFFVIYYLPLQTLILWFN